MSSKEQIKLKKFDELQKSILKVTCSAYYQNYYYDFPKNLNNPEPLNKLLLNENVTSNSVAGTGLILYQDSHRLLLLSCYHIFDFEDTLKIFYQDENKNKTNFLNTLSIRNGKRVYVYHKNGHNTKAEVLVSDPKNDLAIVLTETSNIVMSELPYYSPFYNAEKLKLGQEVYVIGFPKGFFMISRGVASPAPGRKKFLVDAPFNKGSSGGIVTIFDEQTEKLQYVGMSNSIAYTSETVLGPAPDYEINQKNISIPYTDDDIYYKELKLINYGITFILKSKVIYDFLTENMNRLNGLGFKFEVKYEE